MTLLLTPQPQPKPESNDDGPMSPAIITALHEFGRPATDENMRPIIGSHAWRKNTILQAVFVRGKLGEINTSQAIARHDAGQFYSKLFWLMEPHGRDSTQALNGGRAGGSGLPISLMQQEAGRALASIGSHLGQKDRIILQAVCRDDMLPNQGVRLADCDSETRVFARFRDALDELILAIETARKSGFLKFNMERV